MLKTMRLISVAAAAALALPALAGSWPPIAPRKASKAAPAIVVPAPDRATRSLDGFEPAAGEAGWQLVQPSYVLANGSFARVDTAPRTAIATTKAAPPSDFEYVGGDAGWALSQHKYVFAGGRLAMSDECDHVVRIVKAPTPVEIETARTQSPGA